MRHDNTFLVLWVIAASISIGFNLAFHLTVWQCLVTDFTIGLFGTAILRTWWEL